MLIGVPKEIKNHEYRVGLTPSSVAELKSYGHQILVEHNAGDAIDFSDDQYLHCLLYTSPSPRDRSLSRMPSSA